MTPPPHAVRRQRLGGGRLGLHVLLPRRAGLRRAGAGAKRHVVICGRRRFRRLLRTEGGGG